jgi:hypothetical protein
MKNINEGASMNKRTLLIILVILAALVASGLYIASKQVKKKDDTQTTTAYPAGSKKACELLPLSTAKDFLGEAAVRNTTVSESDQGSTEEVDISSCTYDESRGSANVINLTVRGAHSSQSSYNTNRYAFEDARALAPDLAHDEQASEDIPSLGDDAYYNPSTKQVNIMIKAGRYWLVIQAPDRDMQVKVGHKVLQQLGL